MLLLFKLFNLCRSDVRDAAKCNAGGNSARKIDAIINSNEVHFFPPAIRMAFIVQGRKRRNAWNVVNDHSLSILLLLFFFLAQFLFPFAVQLH